MGRNENRSIPMLPKRWQKDENRHVFFAFPPKAQNQQIKAGLLAHLIFAGLLSRLSEKWHSRAKTFSFRFIRKTD
jgi:hypothetical protein